MDEDPGYRQWVAPKARAVLLLVHGLGANIARWEATAGFFLNNSISSYALECPRPEEYSHYILRLHDIISKNNPGKKIFLVGESLGGLYSFLLASRRSGLFGGLICFSPAFSSKLKLSTLDYLKIFISLLYDRRKEFKLPFDSSMCTRDSDYARKMDSDELEKRQVASGSVLDTLLTQAAARSAGKTLTTPVLFLIAGADKIVDTKATVDIFKALAVKDKTLVEYPGMYHSLSIDLDNEKVFEDMLKWTNKRI